MKTGIVAILAVLSLGSSYVAHGTTFTERPFAQTLSETPTVVRGTTGQSKGEWVVFANKRLYTFTELKISEVLRGDLSPRTIWVREMGGQKDGVGLEVAGAARFQPGEDVVLMVQPATPSVFEGAPVYEIRGLMTGKMSVRQKADGTEVVEGMALDPVNQLAPEAEGDRSNSEPDSLRQLKLDQLRQIIRNSQYGVAPTPSASPLQKVGVGEREGAQAPSPGPTSGRESTGSESVRREGEPKSADVEVTDGSFGGWEWGLAMIAGALAAVVLVLIWLSRRR